MTGEPPAPIESPCQRICVVDGMTSQCMGCGRTLKEIAQWTRYTPQERRTIMDALSARLEAMTR
jgi:predicted Fe-S protein YdhL (DUF1289 family)